MPPLESQKKSTTSLYTTIGVIVLIVIALMVYGYRSQKSVPTQTQTEDQTQIKTKENVTVKQVDLTTSSGQKTPEGFPSFITINSAAIITQSYKAEFPDREVTQYTVGFTLKDSVTKSAEYYRVLMKKNGFTVEDDITNETSQAFHGTKDGNSMTVTVTKNATGSEVIIGYLLKL